MKAQGRRFRIPSRKSTLGSGAGRLRTLAQHRPDLGEQGHHVEVSAPKSLLSSTARSSALRAIAIAGGAHAPPRTPVTRIAPITSAVVVPISKVPSAPNKRGTAADPRTPKIAVRRCERSKMVLRPSRRERRTPKPTPDTSPYRPNPMVQSKTRSVKPHASGATTPSTRPIPAPITDQKAPQVRPTPSRPRSRRTSLLT